ncbi:MAG: autotransporter outer membrane beta-barrel domain-containing protein [Deltaproteobacteria bacterium]|nr:autotransporter outer membrane beta-barrel domain-containing protein [Deltaproteobacteria bacterium]
MLWADVFSALDSLPQAQIQSAYDQLSPEPYDAHTTVALSSGLLFARGLLERPLDCVRRTHQKLENNLTSHVVCDQGLWEPWLITFNQSQERESDSLEFDADITGLMAGFSKRFSDDFSFSLGIGGATGGADLTSTRGETEYTGALAGFAAAWDRGPWRFKTAAAYQHGWHDMERRIEFTIPDYLNDSDNDSDGVTAIFETSYGMMSKNGWEIRPSVALDYAYLTEDSAEETEEADGYILNLHVDERDNSVAAGSVGVRFSKSSSRYRYIISDVLSDGVWTSDFSVRARGVITGYERDIKSSFEGAPGIPVKVTAEDSRVMGEIGAGLTFQPRDSNSTLGIEYHVNMGDESTSQTIQGNVRVGMDQSFVVGKLEPLLFGKKYKYSFAKY